MQLLMSGGEASVKRNAFKTPPPTIKAPTPGPSTDKGSRSEKPKDSVKTNLGKKLDPEEVAKTQGKETPATDAAKMARLRRMCEVKPSGKCNVPDEVHKRWLHGNQAEREALCDELEAAHWSKDCLF